MYQHRELVSTAADSAEDYTVQTAQHKLNRKIFLRKLLICVCVFSCVVVIAAANTLCGAIDLFKSDHSTPTVSPSSGMENSKVFDFIDTSYDPCEDFYEYSCGRWRSTPPDAAVWGTFKELELDNYHKLAGYLSQHVSTNDPDAIKKAKYIYSACIDTDYIEENYVDQLYSFMIKAGGWENGDFSPYNSWSINNNLYQDHYLGSSALFTFGSLPDDLNSSKQVIKVTGIAIHMLNRSCQLIMFTYN